ncbi:hypothetical protein [Methylobacterium oxalidis]|uniref:Uncharacterized protein n=1 Tax=Methylobacterium oxalidis TaxID=944322 RepID=A0A512IXR4_9HYPH|nr:hypothetical protein [Methylobacterium oxalidis]GEP02507.1 hypothetical protein MOX02_05450 [Methylobacterium oxalidis]GJE32021.1 hypothetical protein LDDCCGHA_2203 [Methylobacterium oxalidis]GLS67886.1 hypothetical protein GCM10007888_62710 [Methylobacterium oxalidis]
MPRDDFQLRTPDGLQRDPEAASFDNLEDAYLDVCQGITMIAAGLAHAGASRARLMRSAFETSDAEGHFLREVAFTEVLAPDREPRRSSRVLDRKARAEVERTRRLIVAVGRERDALCANLSETHALLARLRALDIGGHGHRQPSRADLSLQSEARERERGRVDGMAALVPDHYREDALVAILGDLLAGDVRQEGPGLCTGLVWAGKLGASVIELRTAVVNVEKVPRHVALRRIQAGAHWSHSRRRPGSKSAIVDFCTEQAVGCHNLGEATRTITAPFQ